MEETIKLLIEVDKEARKRVAKAKKAGLKSSEILAKKKEEILAKNDVDFSATLEEKKAEQAKLIEKKKAEIAEHTKLSLEGLDKAAQQNKAGWIKQIVAEITG